MTDWCGAGTDWGEEFNAHEWDEEAARAVDPIYTIIGNPHPESRRVDWWWQRWRWVSDR